MQKIAIFASGSGTNAENIIRYFQDSSVAEIVLVVYNRKEAAVRERALRLGIPAVYVSKSQFQDAETLLKLLKQYDVTFIVLAGFLLLIPDYLLLAYPHRIVNIHPALLPKHGGKGMYGMRVHEEVVRDGDKESGITIHQIDGDYDRGEIVFQATCEVSPTDTAEEVAQQVHALEYAHFPRVIESICNQLNDVK